MTTEWKDNETIPLSLLGVLAVIAGVSVANLYYNQPLLNLMRADLHVSEFQANLIPMLTQTGYAAGLLFIIPLGDLYRRKRILLTNFAVLVVALLTIGLSNSLYPVLAASLFTGVCSVMPHIFIPLAAQYAPPELKGRNVGLILSGLLTGILASRVISGFVGEYWGWRTMYFIASGLMIACAVVILLLLPDIRPTFRGSYGSLMKSLLTLVRRYPLLRLSSLRSALAFGSFLATWACLTFKLSGPPFYAGSHAVGLLGLCGIAGALTASTVGRYVPRVGLRRFHYIGCTLMLTAWLCLWLGGNSYVGLVAGVILVDIGMQGIQLANQASVFGLCPQASNRLNTIFMTTYFTGGSLGTFLAGCFWQLFAWPGVVAVGIGLAAASLLCNVFSKE